MKKPLCGCLSRSRDEEVQIACKTRGVLRFFRVRGGTEVQMRPRCRCLHPYGAKRDCAAPGCPVRRRPERGGTVRSGAGPSGAERDRTERGQERGRAGRGRDGAGRGERSACGLPSGSAFAFGRSMVCLRASAFAFGRRMACLRASGLCVRPGRYKKAAGSRRDCLPSPKVTLLKTTNPNLNK